jgi:hypothetical protein
MNVLIMECVQEHQCINVPVTMDMKEMIVQRENVQMIVQGKEFATKLMERVYVLVLKDMEVRIVLRKLVKIIVLQTENVLMEFAIVIEVGKVSTVKKRLVLIIVLIEDYV